MESGIYTITSPSGGRYVGSAVNFRLRWNVHRHLLQKGKHHNRGLQRAYLKYGAALRFEKLIVCRVADLVLFEQRAIDVLQPRYNSSPTAGSQLGLRHSAESNEKNAAAHRGKALSVEHRNKISESLLRNPNRNFYCGPMAAATKAKISKALKGRGPPPEHMERLRLISKGRTLPVEQIARRSATRAANRLAGAR